jgi:two-component system, cell cycle sensor histidine kinase and response regulator CckA
MLAAAMGLTVFLVDDEGQILRLLTRVLTRAGHTVIAAEDGDEALKTFGQHAADIDVMVLDVVIPPRGGAEVLDEVLELRPDLPFMLISGEQIDEGLRVRVEAAAQGSFLRKPFHPDTVLEAIARATSAAD